MKNKALWICTAVLAAFLALGALFYPLAGDSLHFIWDTTETVSAKAPIGALTQNDYIEQSFTCEHDTLSRLVLLPGTMARQNTDILLLELFDSEGNEVYEMQIDTADMADNTEFQFFLVDENGEYPLTDAKGKRFTVRITSTKGVPSDSVTFYYGNGVATGRFDVPVEITEQEALRLNGTPLIDKDGQPCRLYLKVEGISYHWFGQYYWFIYAGASLLMAAYLVWLLYRHRHGKSSLVLYVIGSISKYSFLIRQLVSRDFKTKYKRSVLGVLWSFLNPLLTMSIQYVVFSTIFKNSIPNFIIYLLTGIICLNFFTEATTMCLSSIVGNATLINKVYMPKYIYPFSRTLSSGINLLLSLLPLLIMMFVTGTPLRPAVLLLPFGFLMLFMLAYGVGLILATMMVFFRDTQFLWGIFSMLLSYVTPVFYPETIIPGKFMTVYKMNPLYHVIRFVRNLFIDGVSPEPKAYLLCFIICFIPFLVGILVFRKNQDKFILNI